MISDSLRKRFPNGLPDDLKADAQKFEKLSKKSGVVKVTLLSNFGRDVELSLSQGVDIYRGVIVETTGDYVLSEDDKSWFHPQLFKTRTLYASSEFSNVKEGEGPSRIAKFNSSAGLYAIQAFDEIGGLSKTEYVIVDTAVDSLANTQLNHWLSSGMKMKDTYTEMAIQRIDGKTLENHTKELVSSIGKGEIVASFNYNRLYKSAGSYLFYNHALKPVDSQALVQISPLLGYAMVSTKANHIESDVLTASDYLDVSSFTDEQRMRAYVMASWGGKNIVNSFALRKPISNYRNVLNLDSAPTYRMERASFSSCPVVDKLDPKAVLALTPEATAIPEVKAAKLHKHILNNVVKMPATPKILQDVLKNNWKSLLSSKYTDGESLFLPRSIVENL